MFTWLMLCVSPWVSLLPGCEGVAVVDHANHMAMVQPARYEVRARQTKAILSQTYDQGGQPLTIGGMSGIAYLGEVTHEKSQVTWHRFAAVCDAKNGSLVFLDMTFRANGTIDEIELAGGLRLDYQLDFESIATAGPPELGLQQVVFLGEEKTPGLHRYDLTTGKRLSTAEVPKVFTQRYRPPANGRGAVRKTVYPVRGNRGFESLTRHPYSGTLWLANEEALHCDGPASTSEAGTTVRLVRLETAGDTAIPVAQYAYAVDPIHSRKTPRALSGLVELVMLPDGHMLALERSAVESLNPFQHRLYEVDMTGATDISQMDDGLIGQTFTPVGKRLLWKTDWLTSPGNLEGLCLGPKLANGNRVLVGVVDNGDPLSGNVVLSFELSQKQTLPPRAVVAER